LMAAVGVEGMSFVGYVVLTKEVFGPEAPRLGWPAAIEGTFGGVVATRLVSAAGGGGARCPPWARWGAGGGGGGLGGQDGVGAVGGAELGGADRGVPGDHVLPVRARVPVRRVGRRRAAGRRVDRRGPGGDRARRRGAGDARPGRPGAARAQARRRPRARREAG